VDSSIGVYIIDRYTYYALEFLETVKPDSDKNLGQFVSEFYLKRINECAMFFTMFV